MGLSSNFEAILQTKLESRPPLSKNPIGASASKRLRTASIKR